MRRLGHFWRNGLAELRTQHEAVCVQRGLRLSETVFNLGKEVNMTEAIIQLSIIVRANTLARVFRHHKEVRLEEK